jgi:hypothetical protein
MLLAALLVLATTMQAEGEAQVGPVELAHPQLLEEQENEEELAVAASS